jgi:hypothetical protein
MTIKQIVGDDRYDKMRRALQAAFPDQATTITDEAVDAAFQIAKFDWDAPDLRALPIPPLPAAVAPVSPAGATHFEYYEARATHARTAAPGSVFSATLPVVRFRLPDHGTTQTLPVLHSPAGDILPVDRLSPSVDVLWNTYHGDPLLKFGRPERVDMITPPRLGGARFSAISVYLCYAKATAAAPSFYILEAGLATGQPRMPFLGRTMDTVIVAQTQYKPTTFSEPYHYYRGKLAMRADAPSEPERLSVEVFRQAPPTDQYVHVTVEYVKRATPLLTPPFSITVGAAARVQAIADALHIPSELSETWFLRLLDGLELNKLFSVKPH